jgi:hypothetical protein
MSISVHNYETSFSGLPFLDVPPPPPPKKKKKNFLGEFHCIVKKCNAQPAEQHICLEFKKPTYALYFHK